MYISFYTSIHLCISRARTGVLPGNVRFDCAGSVFCGILHVVRLPKPMTIFFSIVGTHFYSFLLTLITLITLIIIIIIIIINHHHHETLSETLKKPSMNPSRNPK